MGRPMNWQAILLWCVLFAAIGGAITNSKGRGWAEGTTLGGLLGVIGLIIVLCLKSRPALPPALPPAGWYPDPLGRKASRYWDGQAWSNELREADQ